MYFVYILQSLSNSRFYVGHCEALIQRFQQHQRGWNKSTKGRSPWSMPYYETYMTRAEAVRRERELKAKKSVESLRRVIQRGQPQDT